MTNKPEGYTVANAVTPHDTNNMSLPCRALSVTAAGNITVIMANGSTVVFAAVVGVWYPVAPKIVKSTATTATGIIAWD